MQSLLPKVTPLRKYLNTCYTGTVERFGEYILEQSVLVRALPELIVDEAGWRSNFIAKLRPRFVFSGQTMLKCIFK